MSRYPRQRDNLLKGKRGLVKAQSRHKNHL
ncbi:hypothetical protein NPIL_138881, partial [Nephila pilipes]